jgi:hypothetical protein
VWCRALVWGQCLMCFIFRFDCAEYWAIGAKQWDSTWSYSIWIILHVSS